MTSSTPNVPATMRAWQWTNVPTTLPAAMKLNSSASVPATAATLKPDQTLVRVHFSSLNPVDYKLPEIPFVGRLLAFRKPGIPSLDYCGTVVATGANRTDLKPGQVVFGMLDIPSFGALAEYAVASPEGCVALPDGIKKEDAATMGVAGLTAWQAIATRLPQKDRGGANVFINGGSGGVGTYGIQIAKAKGCFVAVTCSGRNVELCKRLGADEVIDYTKGGVVDALAKIAKEKGEFDLAADFVDIGGDLYWQSQRYLKKSATYVAIAGSPSLGVAWEMVKVFALPTWLGGGQRKFEFFSAAPKAAQYAELAQLLEKGQVKPVIEEVYEMENAPRAYERLKTGRVSGKLVVQVS